MSEIVPEKPVPLLVEGALMLPNGDIQMQLSEPLASLPIPAEGGE